jgi:hypothetical protein
MRSLATNRTALATLLAVSTLALVASVSASPSVNSAFIKTRVFNDCPSSILNATNSYPASIQFDDQNLSCGGFANLHIWSFSVDGGASAAVFNNGDSFSYGATLELSGTGGEAGLRLSPWWSQEVDGRFNVRIPDGEIACFGGRLPFYSFTGSHGVVYAGGPIELSITYMANQLTLADPGTIEYSVNYGGNFYTSGPLPFDQGNLAEAPVYGTNGILNNARVGGYLQAFLQGGNINAGAIATWTNVSYADLGTIAIETGSFGKLKALY